MNTAQAKKISLYSLLSHLGHNPVETRKSGNEVWYESPFRKEKDASFKIKMNQNIWYDFGEGAGGNILDFVMRFKGCDLKEALAFLDGTPLKQTSDFFKTSNVKQQTPDLFDKVQPEILEVKPVFHYALKEYIKQRCIAPEIAYKYLQEVRYKVEDKEYFALGFRNRAGGYEVRSSIFKGCIGKKDISIIETGSKRISAFEGYMDFLSCLTLSSKDKMESDVLIMNSTALKKSAIAFIRAKGYQEALTYFDNDKGGEGALKSFQNELQGIVVIPCNNLYESFNDFNDLLKDKFINRAM